MKCLTVSAGALLAFALATASTTALADGYRDGYRQVRTDCHKCPPPKKYDSQEVVKTTRDVDHSKVIETQSVVPSRRLIETNHLIIRENETRNVGTVQHNHTVIEKELVLTKRNVDTKNVNTVVNLVEHKYNVERKRMVEERELPGENRTLRDCDCNEEPRHLRVYGMAQRPSQGAPSRPAFGPARYR